MGLELLVKRVRVYSRDDTVKGGKFQCLDFRENKGVEQFENVLFVDVPVENRGVIVDVDPSLVCVIRAFS